MQLQDMILISVDDHVTEPADMFKRHTPDKYKDRFPRQVRDANGCDAWHFEDRVIRNIALNAVAGRRPEDNGIEPDSFDFVRKGCYDVHARIDDMNANGELAGLNFPTWIGFAGKVFYGAKDKDLALAALKAYNDWHVDEWCGAYPGRFIPLGQIPMWDASLAAEEIVRLKRKGCSAISMPPNPARGGLPTIHDAYWNPVWQACNDNQVTICMHIGDTSGVAPSLDSPVDVWLTNFPVSLFSIAADLVFSTVLRGYKDLKFALSEGGIGWVPHFLERIDLVHKTHSPWTHQDFGGRKPSEVFLDHVYTCFIADETGIELRHRAGLDNITWECDYPHGDSFWPRSPEVLWDSLKNVPKAEIDKITHLNAMRAFHFDPFQHITREQATVGALRSQAAHVDLGYLPTPGQEAAVIKPRGDGSIGVISMRTYNKMFDRDSKSIGG